MVGLLLGVVDPAGVPEVQDIVPLGRAGLHAASRDEGCVLGDVGGQGIRRRRSRDRGEDRGRGRYGLLVLVLADHQIDARVGGVGEGLGHRDVHGLLDADPLSGDEHPG